MKYFKLCRTNVALDLCPTKTKYDFAKTNSGSSQTFMFWIEITLPFNSQGMTKKFRNRNPPDNLSGFWDDLLAGN